MFDHNKYDDYNERDFFDKVIIPAHWGMARQDIVFTLHDTTESLILVSDKYAKHIGFKIFQEAMSKRPGHDYARLYDDGQELFNMQMAHLAKTKKPFDYMYKEKLNSSELFLSTTEPIFDMQGTLIGKKEIARPIQLLSHRQIVEHHFNRHGTNLAALQNISQAVPRLSEKEEIILFMLIAGYSQSEIAECLKCSRSYVAKLIAENLCPKFNLSLLSTKLLVDKAVTMGFALIIPDIFLNVINAQFAKG